MSSVVSIEKATLYDKYRLPYANEMVGDLLEHIGEVRIVVDMGAGTGQLARLFVNRSDKVYAIEPDSAMRQVASTFRRDSAKLEILAGFAEHIPLAKNSVDLIVVGNAFHRFKPEACEELRRVLKKQGWLALVTYRFTDEAFTGMLFPKLAELKGVATRIAKAWHRTPPQMVFGDESIHTLRYSQSHIEDWEAFFGAACAGIEAPARNDDEFAAFEALNHRVFEAFAVDGQIQIEYETNVAFGQLM